jgi:UDP-N-acetylmuramoyl-L-alanyl-D-glutamate--2,6-diaminopimelate ligase
MFLGMLLSELAETVQGATVAGHTTGDVVVSGLAYDSRTVRPGYLFLAVPGARHDGHEFVSAVVAAGAAAVIVQADRAGRFADLGVPRLVVPDVRAAMAPLAARFYGDPTRALFLAGVTGTNGKTTVTRMIDSIARAAGDTTGVVGTLGATVAGEDLPGERTTPEAPDLQALFARMVERGVRSAAIEVASHAIAQGRTEACAFDVGVFTNLTQDHLDYHGTMEAYQETKLRLFTDYADAARDAGKAFAAVLNADDAAGRAFAERTRAARVLTYAARPGQTADVRAADARLGVDRITFTAHRAGGAFPVELGFGGAFNVSNALAAVGYGVARGLPADVIAEGLRTCPPVPGRFQPVRAGQDFTVLVDYAHTPDGLENVLRSVRELPHERLLVVFGCGGDRDRTKRPKMGRIARELSDVAFVTSDNPRSENPAAILDEIVAGMDGDGSAVVRRETDRRAAIALAVREARPGDTVVIAGKGHETYQIVGDKTLPFDDVAVAAEEIARCAR